MGQYTARGGECLRTMGKSKFFSPNPQITFAKGSFRVPGEGPSNGEKRLSLLTKTQTYTRWILSKN
jgi:hypothetical protein